MSAAAPQPRLWTREEYYKMAEAGVFRPEERVELIGGRIITMSPQNSPHATVITLLEDALRAVFKAGYVVRAQLPLDLNPSSQPEPDIAVVRGSARDYAQAHPSTALLVIEVSDSTLVFDRGEKASLYAASGIPEYWIVNLLNHRLEVYRDPIPMTGQSYGYGYRSCTHYFAADTVTPLAASQEAVKVADILP